MDTIEDILKFINKKHKKAPTSIKLINFMEKNEFTLSQLVKEWTNTPAKLRKQYKGRYLELYPMNTENGCRILFIRCNKDCNNCKHNIKCALENIT